uniref:Uncharacterized protein n=1 Tax=Hemiselmis andersenii TaxID=464988 RepID=A0A6U4SW40_HEMAN|mmetsp:Transcript_20398/g.46948  ORF Transcript_20398/g.46948 Transcript_20398/m.46948 type:complete len:154 (-) Transcript_20398:160-621(-)
MGCGASNQAPVETDPQPSVNEIQAAKGVSREVAYQEKLGAEFCDKFSQSGSSLRRYSVASSIAPNTPKNGDHSLKLGDDTPLSKRGRRSSSKAATKDMPKTPTRSRSGDGSLLDDLSGHRQGSAEFNADPSTASEKKGSRNNSRNNSFEGDES